LRRGQTGEERGGGKVLRNRGPILLRTDIEELHDCRTRGKAHTLLDVRERSEYALCHIDGSILIPLGELTRHLELLPTDRTVVVMCRSGGRSAAATEMLRAKGYDAHNLAGGILAWSARIDPTMTRY
jgi:sulfur-carrier protein adenylyltransferase/sulfurtransferase